MTDLSRDHRAKLAASLRGLATVMEIDSSAAGFRHNAASVREAAALIAQCEAGPSPVSGPVSGEDGELSADVQKALIRLRMDDTRITDQTPQAKAITTLEHALRELLAERDGLRDHNREQDEMMSAVHERAILAEAALAEAVGLLRKGAPLYLPTLVGLAWRKEVRAFLAKHGKTEEAKT